MTQAWQNEGGWEGQPPRPAGDSGGKTENPDRRAPGDVADHPDATRSTFAEESDPRPTQDPVVEATKGEGAPGPGASALTNLHAQLRPGRTILGKYTVVRKLGEGGMGEVWLIRHATLDVEHALKFITSSQASDSRSRKRLLREAQVMAHFRHPNAVVVHDSSVTEDFPYIIMEYVPGDSLKTRIRPGVPQPLEWVTRILVQLCHALQAAHSQNIVHRDLKPTNLMLMPGHGSGGEVLKVLDFGIAKVMSPAGPEGERGEDELTQMGDFVGSPLYASPEQIEGVEVGPQSDLYSVGVILYELLSGYRPFSGSQAKVISSHLNEPPISPSARNPEARIPPAVERVVLRCLAKDPADRPQSAAELMAEFVRAARAAEEDEFDPDVGHAGVAEVRPNGVIGRARWVAPAVAAFLGTAVLVGIGLSHRYDAASVSSGEPPRPRTAEPGPGSTGQEAVDRPPIGAAEPRAEAAPAVRISDGVRFLRQEDGHYLPGRYHPDRDAGVAEDGWPLAIVRDDGVRFVRIAGGSFEMGSNQSESSRPIHPVEVGGFYIQVHEVTNGEVEAYLEAEGDRAPPLRRWAEFRDELAAKSDSETARSHPAVALSHQEAETIAAWAEGRLPAEAQWEYAARSRGRSGDEVEGVAAGLRDGKPAWRLANLNTLHRDDPPPLRTASAGSYATDETEQGIFDMMGNVREWCRDPYAPYPKGAAVDAAVFTAPESGAYVVRGGSFVSSLSEGRTTSRNGLAPAESAGDLGFRVVIEIPFPSDPQVESR